MKKKTKKSAFPKENGESWRFPLLEREYISKKKRKKTAFRKENGESWRFPLLEQERISGKKRKYSLYDFHSDGVALPGIRRRRELHARYLLEDIAVISAGSE